MSTYLNCLTETARMGADGMCFLWEMRGCHLTVAEYPPLTGAVIDICLCVEMSISTSGRCFRMS